MELSGRETIGKSGKRRLLPFASSCTLILSLISCAPAFKANLDVAMEHKIFWPGAPEKPRITYLWSLYSLMPEGSSVMDMLAGKYEFYDVKAAPVLLKPMYASRRADNLYIADAGAARVTVINLKSREVFHVGVEEKGELSLPVCVVTDPEGNIYVSDATLHKVYKYDPKGRFIKDFPFEGARPVGLFYEDASQSLYVSDTAGHAVHVFDKEGKLRFTIGKRGEEDGEFNFPTYLWADSGHLIVADTLNARIQIFDAHGRFLSKFGIRADTFKGFSTPKGVAADTFGNIYVVDSRQDMVKIFDKDGNILLSLGSEGNDYGKFNLPNGIFIDKENTIYVSDTYNMRIQAFSLIKGAE